MDQDKFTYIIGGKKYIQRPITLGQARKLSSLVKHIVKAFMELDDFNAGAIFFAFGDLLPQAIAIVLLEEDKISGKSLDAIRDYLRSRDIEALASDIEWTSYPLQNMQVIEDFFDCNPAASLFVQFAGLTEKITSMIPRMKTSLNPSSASSPEATSPSGTTSSGDTPSKSANLI